MSAPAIVTYDGNEYMLVEAECCRTWEVDPRFRIGRCGYCGERPKILWQEAEKP